MACPECDEARVKDVLVTVSAAGASLKLVSTMRKIDNKEIDEIGKALVKTATISLRDVDRIVGDPALFDAIRAQVKSEDRDAVRRRSFLRPVVGVFASIIMVAALTLAFVVFESGTGDVAVVPMPEAPQTPGPNRFTKPDNVVDDNIRRTAPAVKAERISTRPTIKGKVSRSKQAASKPVRYEGDFYALSYAGDPNETERGGRIVRVDIPRTTLFAMGVDVPLENETATVKADLLIGNDGVARAIRVVK